MNAIKKHMREFIAIVVLVLLSLLVGGYILSQQRFNLPGWVPILGKSFFTLKAEFSTAQALTPGQGQTVDVAGIAVGEIDNVQLKNGRALVTMKLQKKYDTVYPDATMLMRPKTGLKDMVIEMDPGNAKSGHKLKSGATIPISQTQPDVNLDEILGALDTDTRAYLRLLLGGGGQGLRDNTDDLSSTLRRFDPTSRDLAKITSQLKLRRANIRRTVHNFQLLSTALGQKDNQLAQLVDSSDAVFRAFASEDRNIQNTLTQLPPTLQDTQVTLGKVTTLANTLGPTLQALRPGARALGPSLAETRPFLRESTPILRDQIRPFTIAALPTVKALRPAANDLAALTPDLSTTFDVLNYALNELAYNPPGPNDEGYLFWLSWANQDAPAVFSTQDAHGPIRRGQLLISCTSAGVLASVGKVNPFLKTVLDLLNPVQQSQVCPEQAGAGSGAAPGTGAVPEGGSTTVPSVTTPVVTTPSVTVPTP
jgi:phospholipid/cholesterol/gamma-HCH transport system substrate-binding protein